MEISIDALFVDLNRRTMTARHPDTASTCLFGPKLQCMPREEENAELIADRDK
jgi:hypothetical protein